MRREKMIRYLPFEKLKVGDTFTDGTDADPALLMKVAPQFDGRDVNDPTTPKASFVQEGAHPLTGRTEVNAVCLDGGSGQLANGALLGFSPKSLVLVSDALCDERFPQ